MLDQVATIALSDQLWRAVASKTELPCGKGAFFGGQGGSRDGQSRRHYVRYQLREQALLFFGGECHAVYTKDASPKGIAFLSPVQVFPKDHIRLLLNNCQVIDLELARCRRIAPKCYECGAVFANGVVPPGFYARLISQRRRH